MRRTLISVVLGVIITGLCVSGLAAGRRWKGTGPLVGVVPGRGFRWSENPVYRREQVFFVLLFGSFPLVVLAIVQISDPAPRKGPRKRTEGDRLPDDFEKKIRKP